MPARTPTPSAVTCVGSCGERLAGVPEKEHGNSIEAAIRRNSRITFKRLEHMKEDYELIGDVRGIGMMIGSNW